MLAVLPLSFDYGQNQHYSTWAAVARVAPLDYLTRLRSVAKNAWIVVEKILEPGEALREEWPIDGTTGYDFLNELNGLFVKASSLPELREFYAEFSGETREFAELSRMQAGEARGKLVISLE